jgi:hypothetical protein
MVNNRSHYPVLSLDEISSLHDEILRRRFFENKSKIESKGDFKKKNFKLIRHIETECCYIQRELQIREIRKSTHAKYIARQVGQRGFNRGPRFASHN